LPSNAAFNSNLCHYVKGAGKWDALNWVTQIAFDLMFIKLVGGRAFTYLLASVFLGGGLHPIAGHFISEHYVFSPGQETYSYYGGALSPLLSALCSPPSRISYSPILPSPLLSSPLLPSFS